MTGKVAVTIFSLAVVAAVGCSVANPTPFTPTWKSVIGSLDGYTK